LDSQYFCANTQFKKIRRFNAGGGLTPNPHLGTPVLL